MSIYIALVLLDALALWLFIYARGKWQIKLAAILIMLGFNFFVWQALATFSGWPTHQKPPARSVFVQAVVNEPDPQTNDPGSIYLWLVPLTKPGSPLGYQSNGNEPRAYYLPYSEALYQQVLKAQQQQKKGHGQPVIVQSARRHGGVRGSQTHGASIPYSMHTYVLPPTKPPRKSGD